MCRRRRRFLFTQRRPRGRRRRPKVNDGRGRDFLFSQLVLCVCVSARTRVTPSSPWEKSCGRMRGEERKNETTTTTTRIVTQTTPKVQKNKWRRYRNEKLNRGEKKESESCDYDHLLQGGGRANCREKKKNWITHFFVSFIFDGTGTHTHTREKDGKPTKLKDQHSPFCKILIWKKFFVSLLKIAGQR